MASQYNRYQLEQMRNNANATFDSVINKIKETEREYIARAAQLEQSKATEAQLRNKIAELQSEYDTMSQRYKSLYDNALLDMRVGQQDLKLVKAAKDSAENKLKTAKRTIHILRTQLTKAKKDFHAVKRELDRCKQGVSPTTVAAPLAVKAAVQPSQFTRSLSRTLTPSPPSAKTPAFRTTHDSHSAAETDADNRAHERPTSTYEDHGLFTAIQKHRAADVLRILDDKTQFPRNTVQRQQVLEDALEWMNTNDAYKSFQSEHDIDIDNRNAFNQVKTAYESELRYQQYYEYSKPERLIYLRVLLAFLSEKAHGGLVLTTTDQAIRDDAGDKTYVHIEFC